MDANEGEELKIATKITSSLKITTKIWKCDELGATSSRQRSPQLQSPDAGRKHTVITVQGRDWLPPPQLTLLSWAAGQLALAIMKIWCKNRIDTSRHSLSCNARSNLFSSIRNGLKRERELYDFYRDTGTRYQYGNCSSSWVNGSSLFAWLCVRRFPWMNQNYVAHSLNEHGTVTKHARYAQLKTRYRFDCW